MRNVLETSESQAASYLAEKAEYLPQIFGCVSKEHKDIAMKVASMFSKQNTDYNVIHTVTGTNNISLH